jgi:hypothetical protein
LFYVILDAKREKKKEESGVHKDLKRSRQARATYQDNFKALRCKDLDTK